MRPLKLSLSGFTCFREPVEIGFADLELFAIVGQTGAGKSSILDGITYALFGETPRLGSKGLEALVSLGASSMYAVLEFEASDAKTYRVSRVWSRKASEKALRFERLEAERWVTAAEGVKIKEVEEAIRRVVGLDFSGFTRAILLPQGEFDRFLRGNATERRELLKTLLGVERIEAMMRRAGEIAREARGRLEAIQAVLAGAEGVTPDFIESQRDALLQTETQLQQTQVALQQGRLELTEAREVIGLHREQAALRAQQQSWSARAPEAAAALERARGARRVAALMPVLHTLERALRAETSASAEVTKRTAQLEDLQRRQAQALEAHQAAVEAALEIVDLDTRITRLNVVKPKLERLRALGGSEAQADARYHWDEAGFQLLDALKNQLALLRKLEREHRDLERQGEAGALELSQLTEARTRTETLLETLKLEGRQLGEREKKLEADLSAARRENLRAQLTQGLNPGDPCPICHAPLETLPEVGESRVPGLEAKLAALRAQLQDKRAEYKATQETLKHHGAALERLETNLEALGGRRAETGADLDRLKLEFSRAIGETEDPQSALQEARDRLLSGLAAEIVAVTGGEGVEAQIVALGGRRRSLEEAQRRSERALSEQGAARASAQTALEAALALEAERRAETEEWRGELNRALQAADCASPEAARAAALEEAKIVELEQFERQYTEQSHRLRDAAALLVERLRGRQISPEAFAELEASVSALEARGTALTQQQGRLEQVIADLQSRLREKNRLTAEAGALERRYDTYAALGNDLKGNQFQDYLLSQVQRDLLARASSVMREVTRDRYTLTLEEGEFSVQDAWNGMDARSVRTLSGGESFIASLALALALSDYLAGSKALGALFLDEGFGTLDLEALDAVAAVLETLNTQGRTVGVITHVSALAERLPNRLVVEKAQDSSRAYWSD